MLNSLMKAINHNATIDRKIYLVFFGTLAFLYILSVGSWKQNYTRVWIPYDRFNKTFVIVTGAEGSGTGFFALNLGSSPKSFVSQLGKLSNSVFVPEHGEFEPKHNVTFPRFFKRDREWNSFSAANHIMWGPGPLEEVRNAKRAFPQLIHHLFSQVYPTKTLLFSHRSSPDYDSLHYPDISQELFDIFESQGYNLKILVSYRDPMSSSYSKVRRNFTHLIPPGGSNADLYYSARSVEMHLTLLASQLENLDPSNYLVLSFDNFLENVICTNANFNVLSPLQQLKNCLNFLGFLQKRLSLYF